MKQVVYIETSVLSYLTALPSRDIVVAARQQITRDWWLTRHGFELVVSEAVLAEAAQGDAVAAKRRLAAAAGMRVLPATTDAETLAATLLQAAAMPSKAAIDAVHVAMATVHGIDYLMTWNCTHIANATELPRIYKLLNEVGLSGMLVCAPIEFFGGT